MMMDKIKIEKHTKNLFSSILLKLKPPEKITVSQWADKYRKLPAESSAEPGQWKTSKTPYLKKIMDSISDDKVRKVVIMSSAQIGKSEVILNTLGYYSDIDPSSILMVQPTVDMGKDFSKERITPMIRDTPALNKVMGKEKIKNSKDTILKKYFPGGFIAIVGANSPVGLASRPIKILEADEIDRWPESAGNEGDPLAIVEKRTTTYPYSHKKIYTSTPTIDGISRIQHEYNLGSMEQWRLPCPSCDNYQNIIWANIVFKLDKDTKKLTDEDILLVCTACGELNNEYLWKSGIGKWFPQAENEEIKSFHLNSLVSPWKTWRQVVEAFLSSKNDPEMLKVWTNTELGEVWVEDGETIDDNELSRRREYYNCIVPDDVLVITCGVDVQDDRFELEVVGFGIGKVSWGIEYKTIYGDTSMQETWNRLDQHLSTMYPYEDGKTLRIERTAIDSGGHRTTECYKFCKTREHRGIYAIKGKGGAGIHIIHSVSKTKKEGNTLFIIGTDAGKSMLFSRLAITDDKKAGYCHFPAETEKNYIDDYFKGLTSETKRTTMKQGRVKIMWVKKNGVKNEPLDCRIYAMAALEILNPNFEELKNRKNMVRRPINKKRRGTVNKGVEL
jgi:phage terminase large subunit GpA-like protein